MYTIEVFGEPGANLEEIRKDVINRTGTAPQFHDKGTHVVAHHKLDYDLLKAIQDMPNVREVVGTSGGSTASIGATHEPSTRESRKKSLSRNY